MDQLFLLYSTLLLVTFSVLIVLLYFTFKNKFIKIRDWLSIFGGICILTLSIVLVNTTINIDDKLKVEFKVPSDFYSEFQKDSIDNPLDQKILYKYLLTMRSPHPKVLVAQAIQESSFNSALYKRNHNFTSMKNSKKRTTTSGEGRGEFKYYRDWQECVTDYIFWQFTHNADKMTQTEYLNFVGSIYAEDTEYQNKITKIINKTNWEKLERE